jgi:hypothetical protein
MSEIIQELVHSFKIWTLEVNVEFQRKSCTTCQPEIKQNLGKTGLSTLKIMVSVGISDAAQDVVRAVFERRIT